MTIDTQPTKQGFDAVSNKRNNTTSDTDDYNTKVFSGKQAQIDKVRSQLASNGFIPAAFLESEVNWFYNNLGIDDEYFQVESVDTVCNHILALYGAKIESYTEQKNVLNFNLVKENDESCVYIHSSKPGVSQLNGPDYENKIDEKYLNTSCRDRAFRLESYRAKGATSSNDSSSQLRCYFVTKCDFVNPYPTPEQEADIKQIADKRFLSKATEQTCQSYEKLIRNVLQRSGPVIEVYEVKGTQEHRLLIGYRQQSTQGFFSGMSDLYHFYDLYSIRKYVEQFSNGVTVMNIHLKQLPTAQSASLEHSIYQVVKETSLIYCLPSTPLLGFFKTNKLSVQETVYGFVAWIFAQHFLNRLGKEYLSLTNILDETNPTHEEVLASMKKRLRQDTFTREDISNILMAYPELIKVLYVNFASVHYINQSGVRLNPTISYQRMTAVENLSVDELRRKIANTTSNPREQLVFDSILTFNQHILKTNFYQSTKVALSFRLDPSFLSEIGYPSQPHGIFLVVGSEFRGFHVRFRDVARGGIRIIRSRNNEAYSINQRSLFDENYSLAATQQRKNKDIPEGGSKGTILLDIDQQDKPREAFQKYIDSLLDLLIDGQSPGIKEKLVDRIGRPEILFLGPDEGTADYMDWASQHARRRQATFWKAFTTGKSQSLGGIPHDMYGMTTRSVHQYVLGIYRAFGLKEEDCTKLQTGGPDGDLGSNEIKISKDKTKAIVDGAGVLYDPHGINRDELVRLANARLMIDHFDVHLLSPQGFRVLVDDMNVTLPNGDLVDNGLTFRNGFHTHPLASATLFVPCGGRPESLDLDNVHTVIRPDGTPFFRFIVEGANLFLTQEARLRLEKHGVVVFKDASANKGGVTSSSLEVLAALAFTDDEFEQHMCIKPDHPPPAFYERYVAQVQQTIEQNAKVEFEALWREHKKTNMPISLLSDNISTAIVQLTEQLQHSGLWDHVELRHAVLTKAFPQLLLEKVGLDSLVTRVPENYVKAIFGAYLASQFVYKYGPHPDHFAFFDFMRENYYAEAG